MKTTRVAPDRMEKGLAEMYEHWIDYLEDQLAARPDHPDVWCSFGQALHLAGRVDEAVDALEQALHRNPNYLDAAIARAFALGDAGRVREGYAALRPLSGIAPDAGETVLAIGVYCMRYGFTDTGLAQLRRAAELSPKLAYVRRYLARALEKVGDESGASEQRSRAAEFEVLSSGSVESGGGVSSSSADLVGDTWLAPSLARALVERAWFLLRIDDRSASECELSLALELFPGHPHVLVETGRVLQMVGRGAEAEGWFESAIAVDESAHRAHLELSFVHAEAGRMEQAGQHLRAAVDLRPMYPDYRYHLGTLLLDLGRAAEASDQLEQALVLRPDDGHSAMQLAAAYSEQGRREEALELLSSEPCGEWIEAQLLAAEVLAREGRAGEAREVLCQILESDPGHAEARQIMTELID